MTKESETKESEIGYVESMKRILSVSDDEITRELSGKPWNDAHAARYFMDFAQILALLPRCPARILDLGVGPGWTSIFLGKCGYSVLGLDIAPDMIRIANANLPIGIDVTFLCHDYEFPVAQAPFDAVLIYDALHHAYNEGAVISTAHAALCKGGVLLTIEPGFGHSTSADSISVMQRFGTTEKDMEFARQYRIMRAVGFAEVRQYLRLAELQIAPVNGDVGATQGEYFSALRHQTLTADFTSIVVAIK